jgi:hypothetical protein
MSRDIYLSLDKFSTHMHSHTPALNGTYSSIVTSFFSVVYLPIAPPVREQAFNMCAFGEHSTSKL